MGAIIFAVVMLVAGFCAKHFIGNDKDLDEKIKNKQLRLEATENRYEKNEIQEKLDVLTNKRKFNKQISGIVMVVCTVLAVISIVMSVIAIVPTGYTGIKTTFGKVEDDTISSGVNFVLPWQTIVNMDNRTQKVQIDTQAFSSDIQQVDIKLSVNYNIDQETAQLLYKTVGTNYYENVMFPRIQENTKAVFSQYSAESLVEKRNALSQEVAAATASDMKQYGITIVSISIENIDFTDAFTDAVEAKQVAAQKKLTAETEQAQKTMEEEAAAKRAIIAEEAKAKQAVIAAKADLEVVQIQAEASLYAGQREAEMNQRIAESLTPGLIQYKWINQWNGMLPTTVLGEDTSIMMMMEQEK